jgi:histidinol-phosphate aminotransferase
MNERALEPGLKIPTAIDRQVRLDLLPNPYGPVERVIDAVSRFDGWTSLGDDPADLLRERLGARAGVPASWVVLANGIDELHAMIVQWRRDHGPIVLFPPSDPHLEAWIRRHSAQVELARRGKEFAIPVEPTVQHLPRGATLIVMTPNDPTGTIVTVQEAVRLSRQSSLVVIDERHAAYSPRTLAPLVREFDNLALLQTFETFAALTAFPLAWAIAPPEIAREIAARGRPSGPARVSVVAALAALDADAEIVATVRRVMIEKGRLFRQLRKLSMISPPYPSWSNFLLARIERGTSDFFVPRLAERGIVVFEVESPKLPNHLRISGVSTDATYALKQALIDIALDM